MSHRIAAGLVAVALSVTACSGASDTPEPPDSAATANATKSAPPTGAAPSETDTADAPVAVQAEVEVDGDCTGRPQTDGTSTFVSADVEVTNTGNIGARTRVRVAWPVGKNGRLAKTRSLRLRPGRSRDITVSLALTTEDAAAVNDALDRGRQCRASGRVIGAFGAPTESD